MVSSANYTFVQKELSQSLRQSDSSEQFAKPRICMQAIESRLNFDLADIAVAFRDGLFKPGERLLFITEPCVDYGSVVLRDIFLLRFLSQLIEDLLGLGALA